MNTMAYGMTELDLNEMISIDGGVEPITIAIAAYLVGSFLTGIAIGVANK